MKNKSTTPRKGDLVESPYAGRELEDGKTAPVWGRIQSVSRQGFAFVNYFGGLYLESVPFDHLIRTTRCPAQGERVVGGLTSGKARLWKEKL